MDWQTLMLGTLFSIFGIAINYFFPLGLITLNLALLGSICNFLSLVSLSPVGLDLADIFMGLLCGMLLGLVMLSINFQRASASCAREHANRRADRFPGERICLAFAILGGAGGRLDRAEKSNCASQVRS